MRDWIVHQEMGFFVVNKPAGTLSQKDQSGDEDLAAQLKKILEKSGERVPFLAPVHRLDRNTSGLLILARSSAAAKELTDLFQTDKVEKTYLAIVKGDPGEKGRYDQSLRKDERKNQTFLHADGQSALTEFTRLQKLGNSSLVEVKLHTGRSHQIRAHFAGAGHALLGDRKYGKKPWSEIFGRPALHAFRLAVGRAQGELVVEAPLPDDMGQLLQRLGGQPI